jgi:hypothetical protein
LSVDWLDHLKNAQAEVIGIALICKDAQAADSAKRQLYSARATARSQGDKSLDSLSISMSPHSDDILLIYKTEVANAQETGAGGEAGND